MAYLSYSHSSYPILHPYYQLAAKTHSYKFFIVNFPVPFLDKLILPHLLLLLLRLSF